MEIQSVLTFPNPVDLSKTFKIQFTVIGALPGGFQFPFSNESLTEKKLQFIKTKEDSNAG